MSEAQAKQHLKEILASVSPGTVLHLLGQVIREAEEARLGGLDEVAEERLGRRRLSSGSLDTGSTPHCLAEQV
jgi:hypothetical protein